MKIAPLALIGILASTEVAVLVEGDRIGAVGAPAELAKAAPDGKYKGAE